MVVPNFFFKKIKVITFHEIMLAIAEMLAPIKPNLGIRRKFREIFIDEERNIMFLKIFSLPVMFIKYPVEPEIELTNWPINRIIRGGYATAKFWPKNKIKTYFPKTISAIRIGADDQKISFADFLAT